MNAKTAHLRTAIAEIDKLPPDQREKAFAEIAQTLNLSQLEAIPKLLLKIAQERQAAGVAA